MLRPARRSEFDHIYSLLKTSFPIDEYRPYQSQKELLNDPRYTVFVVDDLTALITVWQFESFSFIEHFAVAPECRNQGLGAGILHELISMQSRPVCLEAELPETDLAKRRLGFYQRRGFHVNNYHYIQPAYSVGQNPVPLLILTTGAPITMNQFESIRDILYREVYKTEGLR